MKFWTLPAATLLAACSQVPISYYESDRLQFNPEQFFNGTLIAEGVVRDRKGKVSRYFNANIEARWQDGQGELDETFYWSDGEVQKRVWRFQQTSDRQYKGKANDVAGEAKLVYSGNALQMNYQLEVPLASGRTIALSMDDWLYQVNEDTLINVTTMRKWGIKVGEVVLTMKRVSSATTD